MEEHSELVRYRLEMARATLRDALFLKEQGGSPWGIVNRAYYAMFYATLALLTLVGKGASKHGGVIALFDQYFVKTGNLPQEMSKWLHKAANGNRRRRDPLGIDPRSSIMRGQIQAATPRRPFYPGFLLP